METITQQRQIKENVANIAMARYAVLKFNTPKSKKFKVKDFLPWPDLKEKQAGTSTGTRSAMERLLKKKLLPKRVENYVRLRLRDG